MPPTSGFQTVSGIRPVISVSIAIKDLRGLNRALKIVTYTDGLINQLGGVWITVWRYVRGVIGDLQSIR
jgi:hypothetical protein